MVKLLAVSEFLSGIRGVGYYGRRKEKTRVCAKTHFGLGIEVFGKSYVACGIGRRRRLTVRSGQCSNRRKKARAKFLVLAACIFSLIVN